VRSKQSKSSDRDTTPLPVPKRAGVIRVYDEAGNVIETHEHPIRDSRLFLADANSALTIFTDSSLVFSTS